VRELKRRRGAQRTRTSALPATCFQGLLRARGPAALEWQYRRNGQNVERFPESLSVEITAIPSYCAQPRQLPVWTDKLIEFMGALR
jgi:hypothetical protein